jgi:hypothetical protein
MTIKLIRYFYRKFKEILNAITLAVSLKQLRKRFFSLFCGKSVAVIGGSPGLIGKGLGDKINNFDVVVRLNLLVPTGRERDYGSRTDIRFIGCTLLNKHSKFVDNLSHEQALISTEKNKVFFSGRRKNIFFHHKSLPMKSLNFFTKLTGVSIPKSSCSKPPKSGFVFLSLLLRYGKPKTIGVFGFSLKSEDAWLVVDYRKGNIINYDSAHILGNHSTPDVEINALNVLAEHGFISVY